MKHSGRDDLVSMTAIVAGAVVSVAVTIGSMILSGEDQARYDSYVPIKPSPVEWLRFEQAALSSEESEASAAELLWEIVGTYETIETMTSTNPSHDVVDRTLDDLGAFALDNPLDPFAQGVYLKALRVAEYYAMEGGDERRAEWLQARFDVYAPLVLRYESAGLESIRFIIQRLDRSCVGSDEELTRLVGVMNRFPDSADVASLFVQGLEKAWSCDPS